MTVYFSANGTEFITINNNIQLNKLVLRVFDDNQLTRDDFLDMMEISLANLPKEQANNFLNKEFVIFSIYVVFHFLRLFVLLESKKSKQ